VLTLLRLTSDFFHCPLVHGYDLLARLDASCGHSVIVSTGSQRQPAAAAAAVAAVSMPPAATAPLWLTRLSSPCSMPARPQAVTVCRLLGLRRSRQRIIDAQQRHLCRPPLILLVEIAAPAFADYRPAYSLYLTLTPPEQTLPTPAPDSSGNSSYCSESTDARHLQPRFLLSKRQRECPQQTELL
jgi:hypothetical protein